MYSDNARGALFMMTAAAAFTLSDTFMKLLSADMGLFQALFLRGVMGSIGFFILAQRMGVFRVRLSPRDTRLIALRVLAEAGAAWFFLTALFHMPLANLTAILQALPLTITLAGALFLGERVGWRRLLAIAVGFMGVMLIVRPDADGFDLHAIYALISVACVTLRDLATRRMTATVPSLGVAFYTALGITLFAAAGLATESWVRPSAVNWAMLAGAALFVFGGYMLSIMAVRIGELGFVTPFRYTGLIWALILGLTVFGDWPDPVTLLGAALIVATGIFTLYREQVQARAQRRRAIAAAAPDHL